MKKGELAFKITIIFLLCLLIVIVSSGGNKMPRGQLDYGMYAPKDTAASCSDMGEVAARLGSIVTYDKRGDVVDLEDFESPVLAWRITPSGAGGYGRLDSTYCQSGSQCLKLHSGDGAEFEANADRGFRQTASKKLGLELSFCYPSSECNFWMVLRHYDGTWYRRAMVEVDIINGKLYIDNGSLGMQEIASIGTILKQAFVFHTIKIVANFDTEKYMRLLFNQNEYDISAYSIFKTAYVTAPYVMPRIWLESIGDTGGDIWVDNVISTQEEP